MRKHGFSAAGTQRFRCVLCSVSTIRKRPDKRARMHARRFQRWLCEGVRSKILAQEEKVSKRTISRSLRQALLHQPESTFCISDIRSELPLLLDGTYIHKRSRCALIAHDTQDVVGFCLSRKEDYVTWLWFLGQHNGIPYAVVSDGYGGIENAVKQVFGSDIRIQRCIVHIKRRSLALLTQNPRLDAGKELRVIVCRLTKITEQHEADMWIADYKKWCVHYDLFLKQRTVIENSKPGKRNWWYTHRAIRSVRSHISNALPYLFTYLSDPRIPSSTNKLEGGINSPLKTLFREHRGMTPDKKVRITYEFLKRKMR
jgi:putative transposase